MAFTGRKSSIVQNMYLNCFWVLVSMSPSVGGWQKVHAMIPGAHSGTMNPQPAHLIKRVTHWHAPCCNVRQARCCLVQVELAWARRVGDPINIQRVVCACLLRNTLFNEQAQKSDHRNRHGWQSLMYFESGRTGVLSTIRIEHCT